MMKAAGILFLSHEDKALFLRRRDDDEKFPGAWDFPGGRAQGDESAEATAIREAREEVGAFPSQMATGLKLHTRTAPVRPGVGIQTNGNAPPPMLEADYSTFLLRCDEFVPELSHEHDGYAWAPPTSPPQPLHPGCQIALDRLNMDELGVARAIAAGYLTSPQRYENMWLFAIRITGTDVAYRDKLDEFVLRKPENYLNEEFLARCNGLPVIFKHPKKSILDSDEFTERVVGTVFLPYVAGTEVWAVAKIFVDDVALMMEESSLSTSPGVNFADFSVNAKLRLEDGAKVLVEGKPSLLDHVAVCELGVWDKGGEPSGIRSESREDATMTEEEKKAMEDKAKKDAAEEKKEEAKDDAAKKDAHRDDDGGHQLDKHLSHLADGMKSMADAIAGFGKRMDALEDLEKKRGDAARDDKKRDDAKRKDDEDKDKEKEEAERLAADKAKKDAAKRKDDEEKEEKEREDAKKAMKDSADLRQRIEDVARQIPKDINDRDYASLADAQAIADDVFADFGLHAPRPLQGETPGAYERRCVRMLKQHSPTWKAAEVTTAFSDDASFGIVRDQVYREAKASARNPAVINAGELRMIERKRDGHTIREFVGQPRNWMDPLAGATQFRSTGDWKTGDLGRR